MSEQHRSREMQTSIVCTTGSERSSPSYTIHFEEVGLHAVNGSAIQVLGASREEAVSWLRSAADILESGGSLKLRGFK